VFAFAIAVASAEAAGGRGGSFHASGIGGGAGIRSGGSSFRSGPVGGSFSRGAPMIRSAPTARTFPGYRSAHTSRGYSGTHFRSSGIRSHGQYTRRTVTSGKQLTVRNRQLGSSALGKETKFNRQLDHRNRNLVTGSVRGVKNASILRNEAFAKHSFRDGKTGAPTKSFHGKFADKNWDKHGKNWDKHHWSNNWDHNWHWRHHHPFVAVGWFGPLFWPYAYWDFVDYTFWPYEYDVFWPYAYDDLYEGVFGPYAYEGPAYASQPVSSRRARRTQERSTTTAVVCSAQAPALTNWPIQQIAETVQPDQAQQSALNDLKDATGKAVNALQSACPDELPSTPTGRLEAMHKRIATMLLALSIVQPPLQRFYDSLNDEQKARFNVISPEAQVARASAGGNGPPGLSEVCGEQTVKANVPTDRIAQALKPTDAQRTALDTLNDATKKAADFLKANCPMDETLTPPGRIAAMEKRLNAMMEGIKLVQPALENFYGSLTDEQKARFNQLGPRPQQS
jgi:LTXXQ motif family protein